MKRTAKYIRLHRICFYASYYAAFHGDSFINCCRAYCSLSSMKRRNNLPEPLHLFRIARVVAIDCTGFPVINVDLLHAAQHQLQTAQQSVECSMYWLCTAITLNTKCTNSDGQNTARDSLLWDILAGRMLGKQQQNESASKC